MEREVDNQGRFERKFLTQELSLNELEQIIKLLPGVFRDLYHPRYVNNIYFDSEEMDSYHQNVSGIARRTKTRIRWYGDLTQHVKSPVLELKHKVGSVGFKEKFNLPSFTFDRSFNNQVIQTCVASSTSPKAILGLVKPVLINRYKRKYFLSCCGRYRVTIDTELSAGALNTVSEISPLRVRHHRTCVVELKYDTPHDDDAPIISSLLPYRMTKSSKYVSALEEIGLC